MNIREKKYAVLLEGKPITEYMYDDVASTESAFFGLIYAEQRKIWAIHAYDRISGKIIFKKENIRSEYAGDSGYKIKLEDGKQYVYFDKLRKIKGPFKSVEFERDLVIVSKLIKNDEGEKVELFGAYHPLSGMILSIKYDYICTKFPTMLEIGYKGKRGFARYDNTYILNPIYDGINYHFGDKLISYHDIKNDKFGVISEEGKTILPCEYDRISFDQERELIYVRKGILYGIYSSEGKEIFAPIFTNYKKQGLVIEVEIGDGRDFGYIPKVDLLLPRRNFTYYNNYIRYFDGYKWRRLKYN